MEDGKRSNDFGGKDIYKEEIDLDLLRVDRETFLSYMNFCLWVFIAEEAFFFLFFFFFFLRKQVVFILIQEGWKGRNSTFSLQKITPFKLRLIQRSFIKLYFKQFSNIE